MAGILNRTLRQMNMKVLERFVRLDKSTTGNPEKAIQFDRLVESLGDRLDMEEFRITERLR